MHKAPVSGADGRLPRGGNKQYFTIIISFSSRTPWWLAMHSYFQFKFINVLLILLVPILPCSLLQENNVRVIWSSQWFHFTHLTIMVSHCRIYSHSVCSIILKSLLPTFLQMYQFLPVCIVLNICMVLSIWPSRYVCSLRVFKTIFWVMSAEENFFKGNRWFCYRK